MSAHRADIQRILELMREKETVLETEHAHTQMLWNKCYGIKEKWRLLKMKDNTFALKMNKDGELLLENSDDAVKAKYKPDSLLLCAPVSYLLMLFCVVIDIAFSAVSSYAFLTTLPS